MRVEIEKYFEVFKPSADFLYGNEIDCIQVAKIGPIYMVIISTLCSNNTVERKEIAFDSVEDVQGFLDLIGVNM